MDRVMFSSSKTEWGTPQWLFDFLREDFKFNLDAAANEQNAKCKRWFGPGSPYAEDAMGQSWRNSVYLNPPYKNMDRWMHKAYQEADKGSSVVCLVAARVDTKWFQIVWDRASVLCFVRGRLQFQGAKDPATFPSAIVVFGRRPADSIIERLSLLGNVIDPADGAILLHQPSDIITKNI